MRWEAGVGGWAVTVAHINHLGCIEHDMWIIILLVFFNSGRGLLLSLTIKLANVEVMGQQLGQFGTLLLLRGIDTFSTGPLFGVVHFIGGEALIQSLVDESLKRIHFIQSLFHSPDY